MSWLLNKSRGKGKGASGSAFFLCYLERGHVEGPAHRRVLFRRVLP